MESKSNLTIPEMLAKLNLMFDRQESIQKQVALLYKEYEQLSEDIEMAENIIMHQSNKEVRKNEVKSLFN